ncbi:hypothetical protein ACFSJY_16205 [Thalassotalea euphylliae]|uniref:hypothetical protein n=1 Tax=Thalassotalea euphylliae TaxID=1655234 RepID=UPI00364089DC
MTLKALKLFGIALLIACTGTAKATFIHDEISVHYDNIFQSDLLSGTTVVGEGVEFVRTDSLRMTYSLDFTESAFTLTVSKPFTAGNFTGIFSALEITGIDTSILDVTFDSLNSSRFSSNAPTIEFSESGSIFISTPFFASANSPATALSHSFTWNVLFDAVEVPNPSVFLLMLLGLFSLVVQRRISRKV